MKSGASWSRRHPDRGAVSNCFYTDFSEHCEEIRNLVGLRQLKGDEHEWL